MKKTILFVGTLIFLLTTIPSYAQKKQKDPNSKTEKVQKARKLETKKIKRTYEVKKPRVMTQVSQRPKVVFTKLEPSKVFNMADLVKATKRLRLRTTSKDFKEEDNSSITKSKTKEEKGKFCTDTRLDTRLNTETFKDFTANGPPDWLKPGIILDASSVINGSNTIEERYERGPIMIATTAASSKFRRDAVGNPQKKSEITVAIANLVSEDREQLHGANIDYSYSEIRSEDELNLKVNGRYSSTFGSIGVKLGMTSNSEQEHHYYLVEFTQTLFSLEVDGLDPTNVFPNNPNLNLRDYVYISQVNYGRKGYFMYKTDTSLEELGVSASTTASYLGNNASIEANLNKISQTSGVEIRAFYYGGRVDSAISDLIADRDDPKWKPLETYMQGDKFSEAEAYPISYKLKNLNNEPVGLSTTNDQTITTCIPNKTFKLKVTLLELQCDTSGDSDKIGDFGITQHIRYKANGGDWKRPIKTTINKFSATCDPGGINRNWDGSTALICGSKNNQIHVNESNEPIRRNPNINSSMVFEINPEEANDRNAVFEIDTWVKEYSNSDVVMNNNPRKTEVEIHDVIAILKGTKLIDNLNTSAYFDGGVNKSLEFYNFDGVSLPLRKVGDNILEGPIRARNRGGDLNQKAFVWMRFEIID